MTKFIKVSMLPAKEGDCLIVEYGDANTHKYILIDAGRAWTYKYALKQTLITRNIQQLELLVVSHVDRDHIDGMQEMLTDTEIDLTVKEVWFNTYLHLEDKSIRDEVDENDVESFSAKMGEYFSTSILKKSWPWNSSFQGKSVKVESASVPIHLSGLNITLLSPTNVKLNALKNTWERECEKAGLVSGFGVEDYEALDDDIESFDILDIDELAAKTFKGDSSVPNGSSIAFILDYDNKRVLFAGDAHEDVLVDEINALGFSEANKLKLDAFKVSHHGSKANISKALLALVECKHFLISTNGNYFKHPNDEAIARIIKFGTPGLTLHFNYKTQHNKHWDKGYYQEEYGYQTKYPEHDEDGFYSLLIN